MDERYWIVKECLNALRNMALPRVRQLELEIKFLRLRVELLKEEGGAIVRKDLTPFRNLKLLVEEYVSTVGGRSKYGEISHCLDTLLTEVGGHSSYSSVNCTTPPFLGAASPSLQPPGASRP